MTSILKHCRGCRSNKLMTFLEFGEHPPANMFVRPEELDDEQPAFPMNAQACLECGMIQIADQVPADFFRHYLYVPAGSTTMVAHLQSLASVLIGVAGDGLVVDIGCNDGTMLAAANAAGARTLGIDPAENVAEIAAAKGVSVHCAYFGPETAREVREKHGPASVISTTNTFHHIGDLHNFMKGVETLLDREGTFVVEVPWLKEIVEKNQFDNIYQEHVSELSVISFQKLGEFFDLEVTNVEKLPIHGGSIRVFLRRRGVAEEIASAVAEIVSEELQAGLLDRQTYERFAQNAREVRSELLGLLSELKASGKRIAGYGAPAKGSTILNFCNIGPETLDFLIDKNELKQGMYSPGTKIPIFSPDKIAKENPDVLLVLAWNFFDEIREQLAEFEIKGGRFLVPIPKPHLVEPLVIAAT